MKRLGIIIPAYNTGENIQNLLQGISDQVTDEVEVIVVDDGSQDNTLEQARHFEKNGIRVIHQENQGVGPARNRGIEESSAEYIWFVDADDIITPNAVKILLETILQHPSDCYLFGVERIFGEKHLILANSENCQYQSSEQISKNFDGIFSVNLLNPLWNKLLKREIIIKNGLRFKNLRSGQDAEFGLRYLTYIHTLYVMTNVLYIYVLMSGSSSSHKFQKSYFVDHEAMFKALNAYCDLHSASVPRLRARWAYEATMGLYRNIYNSLPPKKSFTTFKHRVRQCDAQYQHMMKQLGGSYKVTGISSLLQSSPWLAYHFINLKFRIAASKK